ncbi:exosortase Q [Pseudomonas sp. sp1636]|uniref:exosortase Q n=1 Tax=Pseudomonas sp. sp1636 TaxID=3036707 RepID=UPI0025A554A4|nr:exosortase Q [Pseudomonas sp. sp1636]MDM8347405.1 exosortase Q [Pseudomonas sp. sp1636]
MAGARCSARLPGWAWLLLPTLALWPVWQWSVRRMSDGSDDPFGIVALAALLPMLWRERSRLAAAPRLPGLLLALLLCAVAALTPGLPPLLRAVLAVLALFSGVLALRVPGQALLAWLGLALLALPIMSSLQFFIGYPLRVLTAEVSAWLLRAGGLEVLRQGSTLEVAGQLVMVDAPCSGIQMAWVAYFTAFATAAWLRLTDRQLLRRLPLLGGLVLTGNILRNSVLVLQETGRLDWPSWMHEGTGLLVFVAVCALVLRYVAAGCGMVTHATPAAEHRSPLSPALQGALVLAFVLLALWPLLSKPLAAEPRPDNFVEWPLQFAGQALRPLALSAVEQRFAAQFPGAIARFSAGAQVVTLRHVTRPTRKLHPAADCFRGLGYRIEAMHLEQRTDAAGLQRCFVASGRGTNLRVCEYIEDAGGQSFSDNSAWYWSALSGRSVGPWRAVSTAELLPR